MKVLLIDNYDSFTYNLKQILKELGMNPDVVRNDQINMEELSGYDAILLSPGPGVPDTAGDLKKAIYKAYSKVPILGICLGMQAIGEVFDAHLRLMDEPLHGMATPIFHSNHPLFEGIPTPFTVGRYHSWVIDENKPGDQLEIISKDENDQIMGVKLKNYPVYGLQFHPESIMTKHGKTMIYNFFKETCKNASITQ